MEVLVTGGAGSIGSHLAERLLDEGHAVTVIDNLDPYYDVAIKRRNVERCKAAGADRYTFVEGSITDEPAVKDLFAGADFDVVYHEAA